MKKNFLFALALLMMSAMTISAQNSRSFIREKIEEWGECRNVAITKYNGDLALYGRNGWAGTGLPKTLTEALNEYNENGDYIDDVQLTESGEWLILVGDNGFRWSNVPASLERQMREFNDEGDVVTSVTFNDDGDWIIISQEHIAASGGIQDWLAEGLEKYGQLWAACVTSDAIVACYEDGYRFFGAVPESLKKALKETTLDVYRIKMAGDSWFFCDKQGHFRYHM